MRLFLYCVFDSCSGVYDRPFCANADGEIVPEVPVCLCKAHELVAAGRVVDKARQLDLVDSLEDVGHA